MDKDVFRYPVEWHHHSDGHVMISCDGFPWPVVVEESRLFPRGDKTPEDESYSRMMTLLACANDDTRRVTTAIRDDINRRRGARQLVAFSSVFRDMVVKELHRPEVVERWRQERDEQAVDYVKVNIRKNPCFSPYWAEQGEHVARYIIVDNYGHVAYSDDARLSFVADDDGMIPHATDEYRDCLRLLYPGA